MTKQIQIFEQGTKEYPRRGIAVGNLILLFWIASGTIACWFLYPRVARIYLALGLLMVYKEANIWRLVTVEISRRPGEQGRVV